MEGGTSGYYQFNFGTSDKLSVSINFDKNFIVQSSNPAPVVKGLKLLAIDVTFVTGDHDKEAGKPVYVLVFSRPHNKIYGAGGQYDPKTQVANYSIEDPAKWDYGDKNTVSVKIYQPFYLSNFDGGGYFLVYGQNGDMWQFSAYITFRFSDNTEKKIRWSATFSGNNYPGFNFDKDFKAKEKFTE